MLKRPVIATDITSLDDARYFASWGVDFLKFDLEQIALNRVVEILGWVEGIETIIGFGKSTVYQIEEVLVKIKPYAISSINDSVLQQILHTYPQEKVLLDIGQKGSEKSLIICPCENLDIKTHRVRSGYKPQMFIDRHWSRSTILHLINNSTDVGLVFRTEPHSGTDLQSFEDLDIYLETLEA